MTFWFRAPKRQPVRSVQKSAKPTLECLEDRVVLDAAPQNLVQAFFSPSFVFGAGESAANKLIGGIANGITNSAGGFASCNRVAADTFLLAGIVAGAQGTAALGKASATTLLGASGLSAVSGGAGVSTVLLAGLGAQATVDAAAFLLGATKSVVKDAITSVPACAKDEADAAATVFRAIAGAFSGRSAQAQPTLPSFAAQSVQVMMPAVTQNQGVVVSPGNQQLFNDLVSRGVPPQFAQDALTTVTFPANP